MHHYLLPHPPLLVPGIGEGDEIPNTRAAMRRVAAEIKEDTPDVIVFISPHASFYADYFQVSPGTVNAGDFGQFGAPQLKYYTQIDSQLAKIFIEKAQEIGLNIGNLDLSTDKLDHGVLVPLHFLHEVKIDTPIIYISLSGNTLWEHYRLGMALRHAADSLGRKMTIIASGDMSHKLKDDGPYGYNPAGPKFDTHIQECITSADFIRLLSTDPALYEAAAECGLRSLVILTGACDGYAVTGEILAYEGPFGVGYLSASLTTAGAAPSIFEYIQGFKSEKETAVSRNRTEENAEDPYIKLARENIHNFVRYGRSIALPKNLPAEMLERKAGVFVTIKKNGELRGCVGTITATTESIATEILKNSISACSRDRRFYPVRESELSALKISVDVLSEAESIETSAHLDPKRYGVIVTCGTRRGLLLPMLEGVDTVEEQLSIALLKGGIFANEHYTMQRFEVVRHEL